MLILIYSTKPSRCASAVVQVQVWVLYLYYGYGYGYVYDCLFFSKRCCSHCYLRPAVDETGGEGNTT